MRRKRKKSQTLLRPGRESYTSKYLNDASGVSLRSPSIGRDGGGGEGGEGSTYTRDDAGWKFTFTPGWAQRQGRNGPLLERVTVNVCVSACCHVRALKTCPDQTFPLNVNPTDNDALLISFRLSSDARIFVGKHRPSLRIGRQTCKKNVCATCTCSNRASILHATVGGWWFCAT